MSNVAARVLRAGARGAGVVAGAGGAAVAAGPVAARAPTTVSAAPAPPQHTKVVDDEWTVLGHDGSDQVFLFNAFSADEVDRACADVQALFNTRHHQPSPRPLVQIEEEGSDHSTDGSEATSVIAGTSIPRSVAMTPSERQLGDLLRITSRLLTRPGLQREVVACMMEDEEVRELMLRQAPDLDSYLTAVGIPASLSLLPPAAAAAHASEQADSNGPFVHGFEEAGDEGEDVVSKLVKAVAGGLDKAGSALAFLGGWLRDRLDDFTGASRSDDTDEFLVDHSKADGGAAAATATAEGATAEQAQSQRPRAAAGSRRGADTVLGSVMMVAVVVVCMLVIRRPVASLRLVPMRRL